MPNPLKRFLPFVSIATACSLTAYFVGRAQADGPPLTQTLAYSGTLIEGSAPVSTPRQIVIDIYDVPTNGAPVCTTDPGQDTPVEAGRFRIPLNPDCVAIVQNNAELWVEVKVAGARLGERTKVTAVPYAIEAARASEAAGALALKVVPSGMIAMFASACPPGWTENVAMRGRFPRGEPSGDVGSLDQAGSDDAIVPAHTHGVSGATANDGNHSHDIVLHSAGTGVNLGYWAHDWSTDAFGAGGSPLPLFGGGVQNFMSIPAGGGHSHAINITAASTGVAPGGGRLPSYQEVLFCTKD